MNVSNDICIDCFSYIDIKKKYLKYYVCYWIFKE